MQQDDLALKKAIESGDTDLVYLTLFHMKRKLQSAEFFRIINDKPLACALLEIYAKQQDPQLLRDFYYQDDRRVSSANLIFISNYKQTNVEARISELKAAWKIYGESKTTSNEAKVKYVDTGYRGNYKATSSTATIGKRNQSSVC